MSIASRSVLQLPKGKLKIHLCLVALESKNSSDLSKQHVGQVEAAPNAPIFNVL